MHFYNHIDHFQSVLFFYYLISRLNCWLYSKIPLCVEYIKEWWGWCHLTPMYTYDDRREPFSIACQITKTHNNGKMSQTSRVCLSFHAIYLLQW